MKLNKNLVFGFLITIGLLLVPLSTSANIATSDVPTAIVKTDNTVLAKNEGAISIEAGPKQLEKINDLYGKVITQAEFIKTVYPEALEVIPSEVLKEYENMRFVFGQEDTSLSDQSKYIDSNNTTWGLIGLTSTAGRAGPASEQSHDAKTTATVPCTSLSTTSTLEKNISGSIVTVSSAYDFSANTVLSYAVAFYSGTPGKYRSVGYHAVTAPPGYQPPVWSNTSFDQYYFYQVN